MIMNTPEGNDHDLILQDGFYPILQSFDRATIQKKISGKKDEDVQQALARSFLKIEDYLALLSPAAEPYLELMARRAQDETIRHFGFTIQLFTPLYLANYCTNHCVYCGFNATLPISRRMLTFEEVRQEAQTIAATGLRRLLVLTGDAPRKTDMEYITRCLDILAVHFPSMGIELPAMTTEEYSRIVEAGAESITMFQETYHEELYAQLHPAGPKRNFLFRLNAPHRAIMGGMRSVNLGALLGLDDWRTDSFYTGLHASFLQKKFPVVDVSVSFPRIRPYRFPTEQQKQAFIPHTVTDKNLIQAILAFRCYMPHTGITLSSRESVQLRDRLIPLGITRFSAGVSTAVGGHIATSTGTDTDKENSPQFDISDPRSVEEISAAIENLGYQPVYADWLLPGDGTAEISGSIHQSLMNQAEEKTA